MADLIGMEFKTFPFYLQKQRMKREKNTDEHARSDKCQLSSSAGNSKNQMN